MIMMGKDNTSFSEMWNVHLRTSAKWIKTDIQQFWKIETSALFFFVEKKRKSDEQDNFKMYSMYRNALMVSLFWLYQHELVVWKCNGCINTYWSYQNVSVVWQRVGKCIQCWKHEITKLINTGRMYETVSNVTRHLKCSYQTRTTFWQMERFFKKRSVVELWLQCFIGAKLLASC